MPSPVYDFTVTSVMKAFTERRFAMYYKSEGVRGIPNARVKHNYKKRALLFATGSAGEEYASIAEPCLRFWGRPFVYK